MVKQKITYNDTVKEAIALALFHLLKKKPLNQISISDVTKLAGVSRSSFYRNFNTKEEILSQYIQKCYKEYFKDKQKPLQTDTSFDLNYFLYHRFRFVKQYKDFFVILRKQNLLYYLFEDLDPELSQILSGMEFESPYQKAMFTSCSAGIIRQWIDNNFKESEEEMVKIHTNMTKTKK